MTMAVTRLPLLAEEACDDWVCKVLLLRHAWLRRHPLVPFFTLGKAAYLDKGGEAYDSRHSNLLLWRHFSALLTQVQTALSRHLNDAVELVQTQAALPGFHIYLPHPAFALPVASIHRDLQYRHAFPQAPTAPVLTFTLPLSTPEDSGLTVLDGAGTAFLPYRDGELVVHDGKSPHQAALACDGDCERITLQGHGIYLDRRWLLYW